ncbi:MAG: LTA synthase family protein [Cloacibacillus sp.]
MRQDKRQTAIVIPGFWLPIIAAFLVWLKFFSVDFAAAGVLNWPVFGVEEALGPLRHVVRAAAVAPPSLAAVLCLFIPAAFLPGRFKVGAALALDFLLSVLVGTDRLFIRYYADIFIFHDLTLVSQTGLIVKSIWALLKPWDFLVFADLPIALWLLRTGRVRFDFAAKARRGRAVLVLLFAASLLVQGAALWHLKTSRPNIINAMYDRLSVCAWISSGTFHWWDAISLAHKTLAPRGVPAAQTEEIARWFAASVPAPHARTKAVNLVLVQCESLQYFVTDLAINGVPVTPNLNKFKNECLYYPNAWSQAAGGNSSDAEFMANTGLFPAPFGAAYTLYANDDYNSLARVMRQQRGARAVVVQGTKSAFWNCHRMHPKLWFHKQYSQSTYPDDEAIGLGLSDRAIFTRVLSLFGEMDGPFYGFIVTLTSHHPFDFEGIPKDSLPLPPELQNTLIGNYLLSVNYFDKQFGLFIDGMRERGLLDKSLIVVYGDHPAVPIAYREDMERLLGKSLEDAADWKATRRVTLMFRVPEYAKSPKVLYENAGHMDILPTAAGLMGLKIKTVFGNDLLSSGKKSPVVFRNGSYIDGDTFVEPGIGRASNLKTGERRDDGEFEKETQEAALRLKYSDLILEHNLIEKILKITR